jgi:hypothetical protein
MKKIITILLLALLTFSFASCGEGDGPSVDGFVAAVNNANPEAIEITIKSATALGELSGTYTVTYNEDGSFTIDYVYEKFNDIGEGDDLKSEVTGKVTCDKNGNYSDGGSLTGKVALAEGAKINLAKVKATISADGNSLTATVKAADTKAVLGVEIGYDVDLSISSGKLGVQSVAISYNSGAGPVEIVAVYTYTAE